MKKYKFFPIKILFFLLISSALFAKGWGEIRYAQTTTNIRARRTAESRALGQLTPGQTVRVDFLVNNWYAVFNVEEIVRNESRALGYVYAILLKCNPPYNLTKTKWKNMWGMSISQIKVMEQNELINKLSEGDLYYLHYNGYLLGYKCIAGYMFIKGKLAACTYLLSSIEHKNLNDYIYDYWIFRKILTKRYGETPYSRTGDQFWRNYLYKNNPSSWGKAVSLGHLQYRVLWETPFTVIRLDLWAVDLKPVINIVHCDKKQLPTIKKLTPGWGF